MLPGGSLALPLNTSAKGNGALLQTKRFMLET